MPEDPESGDRDWSSNWISRFAVIREIIKQVGESRSTVAIISSAIDAVAI